MYKVYFEDNTIFEGGNITDSKWNLMPSKPIIKIEYDLLNLNHTIVIEGYDSYNHIIEKGYGLFGNAMKNQILQIILMGKVQNKVHNVIFNFLTKEVTQTITEFGKEFRNKPTLGWKTGKITNQPVIYLKEN